jgi:hypothetical protein
MKKLETALSTLLDNMSEYFAARKGLLPLLGALLVLMNLLMEIIFPAAYLTEIGLFLHLGIILAVFGLVLARAL